MIAEYYLLMRGKSICINFSYRAISHQIKKPFTVRELKKEIYTYVHTYVYAREEWAIWHIPNHFQALKTLRFYKALPVKENIFLYSNFIN